MLVVPCNDARMPSKVMRWTLGWKLAAIGVLQLVLLSTVFVGVGALVNGRRHLGPDASPTPQALPLPPPGPPPDGPERQGIGPRGGARFHVGPLETLFCGGLLILGAGSFLTARSIVRPLRHLSRVVNAFGAGDLRARSGLERGDEIGELARAFDDMGDRIERLLVAEKELLANVSHELRTPLARIRVALDIAGESSPEASRLSLAEVGADLAELETLIEDVFTTTRLEIARGSSAAAQLPVHRRRVGADVLWGQSLDRFRSRHPDRPLQVEVQPDLPTVQVDPMLFRRVLDNLLENAHKYTPASEVPIAVRAARDAEAVLFEVEDHGIGIAKDDLAQVFTPFFRGDRSRTRGTGGVGLGMTLAKRVVEAHGGTIAIESELGSGTTVRVQLPIDAA